METPIQTLRKQIKVYELFVEYLQKDMPRIVAKAQKTEKEVETLIQDYKEQMNVYEKAIEILNERNSVDEGEKSFFQCKKGAIYAEDKCNEVCEECRLGK